MGERRERQPPVERSAAIRYGGALGAAALALGCQWIFRRDLGGAPFLLAFAAIVVAAWLGRAGPGLLVVAIVAAGVTLGALPRHLGDPRSLVPVALFLVEGTLLALWTARVRRALLRAQREVARRRRRERERDLFTAALAHDLGDPVAAIRFSAATLLRTEGLPAPVTELAARMEQSAERTLRLAAQLVELGRSRAGHAPLVRQRTSLNELCRAVLDELRPSLRGRPVVLSAAREVVGSWDRDRLAQVAQNLVSNAARHGTPGTPIAISVGVRDGAALLEVRNQARLIPAAVLAHAFEPFRGGGAGGAGLGLYIARRIVTAHGGAIELCSDETATCARVTLPLGPTADGE